MPILPSPMDARDWFETYIHEPTFTLTCEGYVTAPSAGLWLFAVDDGSTTDVMLSAEFNQGLYMARIDPISDFTPSSSGSTTGTFTVSGGSWTLISLTWNYGLSDHWHLYAHGYHWLSCNDAENDAGVRDIYLVQVDTALSTASAPSSVQAVSNSTSTYEASAAFNAALGASAYVGPTNDHFMIAMWSGLGIGVVHSNNADLRMVFFDKALGLRTNRTSGQQYGDAAMAVVGQQFSAGGFAFRAEATSNDWILLAPQTMLTSSGGPLRFWRTIDNSWTSGSEGTSFEQAGYHIAMPYVVRVGWYYVMTYRRVSTSQAYGEDYGDIVREVYDGNWNLQTTEVLLTASSSRAGNRPHCQRWGNYLITCWDEWDDDAGSGLGVYMRVEEMS